MTCPYCDGWVATSRAQLKTRQRNLGLGGDIYACPKCGTRDWALTTIKIEGEPMETRKDRWLGGALYAALILSCAFVVWYFSKGPTP